MSRSTTSPFKTISGGTASSSSSQIQMLIKSLEQQNSLLVDQITVLKTKVNRLGQLQDRIQMILRHNTQLLSQNQRLARLINQKKSQVEILKNKHDATIANRSNASDIEVKRLLNEIEKLKEEGCQIEHAKNLQINQIKNQHHLELQNLKRNNLGSAQKYELQIRKLKQYSDKKDYEVSDLKMKIARIGKQTDFQIGKLREEKERLRNDLQFQEAEHRKQIQSLKSKFDYNFHSQMQNLKKQHLNQIQTLDYENSKLKEVINSKNLQLQQAIVKQNKTRNHYEDSIELLKKQNNQLKEKLVENQHISDLQLNNLREKLDSIKESELALLKDAHANEVDILNREILKLNKFLDSRNDEIENICRQRNQMRQALEGEVSKLIAALDSQRAQIQVLLAKHEENIRVCDSDYKYKNEEMKSMQSLLNSQIETLKREKKTAEDLLSSKQKQLDRERKETRQTFAKIEEEIRILKDQHTQARDQLQKTIKRSSSDSEDQKKIFQLKSKQYETKISLLQDQVKQNLNLIEELRSNIKLLEKQIKTNDEKIEFLQNTQKQLRNQAKQNFSRWDAKQKQLNRLIRQQIESMQRSKTAQIEQLKSIHDNKSRSLKHQIKQLQRQVEQKNRLINSLKTKYQELVNNFEKVFAQEAARKNLDIKVPGWLPETLALKSLFDVFLKNKVLEYCT